MAMTDKKRKFADAVLSGESNTAAAREAGYSAETAKQQGYKLARDPDILAYIERKQRYESEKAEAVESGEQVNPVSMSRNYSDPQDFLMDVINDPVEDIKLRADCAKALMPYRHAKIGEQGKKGQKEEAAKKAATVSRFRPRAVN